MKSVTLRQRVESLRDRLDKLHKTSSNVTETSNLEGLCSQIRPRVDPLLEQLQKRSLLERESVGILTAPESLIKAAKRSAAILERFKAEPKAATIKKGQSWVALLDEIKLASRDLGTSLKAGWHAYQTEAFAGESPATVRSKLARTKANNAAFATFQSLYNEFRTAFASLPETDADIRRVTKLANQLQKAAKAFDYDVPEEVKRFLEDVNSVSGAAINLLTPSVKLWLEKNSLVDSYTIRSTSRE